MSGKYKKQIVLLVFLLGLIFSFGCYTVVIPPAEYREPSYEEQEYMDVEEDYPEEYESPYDYYRYSFMTNPYDLYFYDPFYWSYGFTGPWHYNTWFGWPSWRQVWGFSPYRFSIYWDPYMYYGGYGGYGYYGYGGYYGGYGYYGYGGYGGYYSGYATEYKKRDLSKRREVTRNSMLGSTPVAGRVSRTVSSSGTNVSDAGGMSKTGNTGRTVIRSRYNGQSTTDRVAKQSTIQKGSVQARSKSGTQRSVIRRSTSKTTSPAVKRSTRTTTQSKSTRAKTNSKTRTVKKKKKGGDDKYLSQYIRSRSSARNRSVIPSTVRRFVDQVNSARSSRYSRSSGRSVMNTRSGYTGRSRSYTAPSRSYSGMSRSYSSSGRSSSMGGSRSVGRASSSSRSSGGGRTVKKK